MQTLRNVNFFFQLEIFHGALNNPKASDKKSFFYLREPIKPDSLPEDQYKVCNIVTTIIIIN